MRFHWLLLGLCLAGGIALGLAWAFGGFAGVPSSPLSDVNGTDRTFPVKESHARLAISNTFRLFRYHDMMLTDAAGSDYLEINWHPTNGLLLIPTVSIIATIPTKSILGQRRLGYVATFCITSTPVGTNETKVNVRTLGSKVLDGIALGHGGIVANKVSVPPVRREEESVLKAIEAELALEAERIDHPAHSTY